LKQIRAFFDDSTNPDTRPAHIGLVFGFLWLLLFCLYYPAAKAGMVADFSGWLDQVKNHSFSEYINRTHFEARSLYQVTQFNTWAFYKLFGINPWAWHLLFITLHVINACLLFVLACRLLADSGVRNGRSIAFGGVLLFSISPYISEVIVWEPAFHFLQGLLFLLLILVLTQRFIHTGATRYAWLAAAVYTLSLFSLEIFYITPWLVLSLALFYRYLPSFGEQVVKRVLLYFFVPMLLLFLIRFAGYRLAYGDWVSRIGAGSVAAMQLQWLGKPAKYLFHLLCMGRFYPFEWRNKVYALCDSVGGILIFYGCLSVAILIIVTKFKQMGGKAKVASLLFVWMVVALLLLIPLWFASDMLVLYDRYTYFAGAFLYMLLAVLASMLAYRYLAVTLIGLFAIVNLRFTIQVSRYWGKSAHIVTSLLNTIPDERDKTMLLLNIPQNMHGVAMIGAEKNSEYKLLHDLILPGKTLTNTVYDVLAYNMLTPADGAHVNVINDSLIKVTLNQWGTWWWFETRGAYSYETAEYKLDLKDPGHWYELTLKKPYGQYLLLYNVGDKWKTVDMSKKDVDQD
jgi:hypothetical protein